jgi:hypothetical protein
MPRLENIDFLTVLDFDSTGSKRDGCHSCIRIASVAIIGADREQRNYYGYYSKQHSKTSHFLFGPCQFAACHALVYGAASGATLAIFQGTPGSDQSMSHVARGNTGLLEGTQAPRFGSGMLFGVGTRCTRYAYIHYTIIVWADCGMGSAGLHTYLTSRIISLIVCLYHHFMV